MTFGSGVINRVRWLADPAPMGKVAPGPFFLKIFEPVFYGVLLLDIGLILDITLIVQNRV